MTVFTTKPKTSPEVKKVIDSAVCIDPSSYERVEAVHPVSRLRHHKVITNCCLPLLIIWLLIASFLAGIFFYRQFYRRPTFYGFCGTNFVQRGRTERLEESLEINPDEYYERINVPRFGFNRPAIFVHDFRKNLTAIVDVTANRCFLKKLDRNLVAPPRSLIDLVEKMERGYYEHSPSVIRETYRVTAQLSKEDLAKLQSHMISRHCSHRALFFLTKASEVTDPPYIVRNKREVKHVKHTPAPIQFTVLSGEAIETDQIIF